MKITLGRSLMFVFIVSLMISMPYFTAYEAHNPIGALPDMTKDYKTVIGNPNGTAGLGSFFSIPAWIIAFIWFILQIIWYGITLIGWIFKLSLFAVSELPTDITIFVTLMFVVLIGIGLINSVKIGASTLGED